MADHRAANMNPAMMSQEKPLVKIGHYALGETLGVGTFGKVKSMEIYSCSPPFYILPHSYFSQFISWRASTNRPQSGCQDFESSENKKPGCGGQNQT